MKNSIFTRIALLVLGLLTVVPAAAQDAHTIRIEDGSVFINGERVPAKDLPSSLDPAGMSATFNLTGGEHAYLGLGGHVYTLQDNRLVEVETGGADDGLVVFFATDTNGKPVRFMKRDESAAGYYQVRSKGDNAYSFYGDALFDQARKMEELKARLVRHNATEIRVGDIEPVVVELTAAAENTARMAEALPRIQFQSYLESIGDRDAVLFEQLQREQEMELRTRTLAQRIRASNDADERTQLTRELRLELEKIFELKQKNREREIEQLAQRLDALETRLKERQELQDEIIEARLYELIGRRDR